MQRAGYATDPRYAEKLTQVINSASLRGVAA
jgi:flagellum-specific peptidoglycan hydrolase FlgJ